MRAVRSTLLAGNRLEAWRRYSAREPAPTAHTEAPPCLAAGRGVIQEDKMGNLLDERELAASFIIKLGRGFSPTSTRGPDYILFVDEREAERIDRERHTAAQASL